MAEYDVTLSESMMPELLERPNALAQLVENVIQQVLEAQISEHVGADRYERTVVRQRVAKFVFFYCALGHPWRRHRRVIALQHLAIYFSIEAQRKRPFLVRYLIKDRYPWRKQCVGSDKVV